MPTSIMWGTVQVNKSTLIFTKVYKLDFLCEKRSPWTSTKCINLTKMYKSGHYGRRETFLVFSKAFTLPRASWIVCLPVFKRLHTFDVCEKQSGHYYTTTRGAPTHKHRWECYYIAYRILLYRLSRKALKSKHNPLDLVK